MSKICSVLAIIANLLMLELMQPIAEEVSDVMLLVVPCKLAEVNSADGFFPTCYIF
jgi:hypothetical protein